MKNIQQIPEPIVKGKIKQVHDDTCWIDLEKSLGIGILHQEESLARNKSEPLEKLNDYIVGKTIKVYIKRSQSRHDSQDKWYVNERWAHDNPWPDLKLKKKDEVRGTIVGTAKGGYFIQLDDFDIETWLPESKVPWSDGSLGDVPNEAGILRLSLEVNDRIKAVVTEIHYPPRSPVISLCRYLARQVRSDKLPEKKQPSRTPLQYSAHIQGDLNAFKKRLAKEKLFAGKQFLIVDDDKLALDALANLLKANGAKVKTVHVESSLGEVLQTILNLIEHETFDLILIDYSLPGRGEGLHLARQLCEQVDNQSIILFTGDPLAELFEHQHAKKCIQSFLRRPLQLDKILACLKGKEYWEVDKAVNLIENRTIISSDLFDARKDVFELLSSAVHVYDLSYAVLIKIVTPHRLEVVYHAGHGKFPTEHHLLERLSITSDLRQLAKGFKTDLQLNPNVHGNDGLKLYSKWAHFLTLGDAKNPSYMLGFGWNKDKKHLLTTSNLWAFALLIQTKLEHKSLKKWLHRQLPFLIQGQLLSGLTHEIRGRFSPWLNYQQALRELWQQYKYSEENERQALAYDIDEALEGMETAYTRLDELMDLMLGGLRQWGVSTPVKTLLEQIKQLFTEQLRQQGIALQIKPAPDITLGFSPLYLLQPLSNLILNSRKHIHRHTGGNVEVITKMEEISQENETKTVLSIYVSDNGPGISSRFVNHIFRPGFSQAVKQEERTGMGLYISNFLLQQIGGNVELIENWRGIGCIFRLQFSLSMESGD